MRSTGINYEWPKVLGYADDLTIITNNDITCINAVLTEYEKFTKVSLLKLNADKTETFYIQSNYVPPGPDLHHVTYLGQNYMLHPLETIKINAWMI